jgi:nitrous oxide reductase accessory protein NosL
MKNNSKRLKKQRQPQTSRPVAHLKRLACLVILLIVGVGVSPPASEGGSGPTPGRLRLDRAGQMHISPEDRCPVCGMKVIKYPKFAAAIQLSDGITFYFCSAGCMIRTWLHPEIFIARNRTDLRKPVIREYFSGRTLDARSVVWVAGSDVIGPMGPAVVPLRDETALETFLSRHGGRETFVLDELTDERWAAITDRKAGR